MASARTETVTSRDGTSIAYDVYGDGPALVYVTGATCHRRFFPVVKDAKTFATSYAVHVLDRRGRGASGDAAEWSLEQELQDIEAVIDAAGGSAHLLGHSSGAVLVMEAALALGDKVERVVMYDPPYVHDEAERASYAKLASEVHELLERGANGAAIKTFLRGIGMPPVLALVMPIMPGWGTMKRLAPTLEYDIALTRDLPPLERAAGIDRPVKVIAGAKSPPEVREVSRALAGAIPGAQHLELDGEDHMVSAAKLLPELQSFLVAER